jgi:hypothetical protein
VSRAWTKVKAGVYTSGGYTAEKKYDRAAGGWMWRLRNDERPANARSEWFPTLEAAKDYVTVWDEHEAKKAAPVSDPNAPDMHADRLANEVISAMMADHNLSVYNAVRKVLIAEFSQEKTTP